MLNRLLQLDRRWIYLLVALSVALPLIFPIGLPILPSTAVRGAYEAIEAVPEGKAILFSFDYGPGTKVELHPMAIAGLHVAFRKNLKVVAMALDPAGQALASQAFTEVGSIYKKVEGTDYVNLGYKAGNEAVVVSLGLDFRSTFPIDARGIAVGQIPLMRSLQKLDDFALVASWSAGRPGALDHIRLTQSTYGRPLIVGVTAVQSPEFYPYYKAGQLKGLLGGLRGAAELEVLAKVKGTATPGMDAQSTAHFMLAFLIILSNVIYFVQRRAAA